MKIFLIRCTLIVLFFSEASFAQVSVVLPDTIYSNNVFQTNFYDDINSANLNVLLNFNKNYNRLGVSLENYYLSNVSKLSRNFYRDYNNFRFLLYYNVNNNFNAGAGLQNRFLTDDKNVETNKNNSNYLFANFDYNLYGNIFLNTKLGVKAEDQIGEFNTGFSGIATATANNFYYKDYLTNANLTLFYEDLQQKQNHNYDINANIYKRFSSETDNTGLFRYYNLLNDIYSPATPSVVLQYGVRNNIERRLENFFQLGDNLNYSLTNNLVFNFSGIFTNRNITKDFKYRAAPGNILFENVYDTKILENNLEVSGALNYNLPKVLSQLKFSIIERSENHSLINTAGYTPIQIGELEKTEKNKNNNSVRATLFGDVLYYVSNTNSVGFTGSTSLLRYDTDFDFNFDDRDETETILSTYYNYNNLLNFNVQTRFEVLLSAVDYIYSERSANNFKNRVFRLSSLSSFTPVKKLLTNNYFQVLANYTVYDYEDIVSQVQSFSYRQLYAVDSTSYNLFRDTYVNFFGALKIYEQGQFDNENFSVKPIAYYVETLAAPNVSYTYNFLINFALGYKFYRQQRYQYVSGTKQLSGTYKTFGPFGKIILYLNNNSIVNFIGGIDKLVSDNPGPNQNSTSVNLQLNVLWNM